MNKSPQFQDFNFKLAVIQVLMYDKAVLQPKFNLYDLKLLPNLKKITLFYDDEEKMVDEFAACGIEAEYL
jgi:hypothetical protein